MTRPGRCFPLSVTGIRLTGGGLTEAFT